AYRHDEGRTLACIFSWGNAFKPGGDKKCRGRCGLRRERSQGSCPVLPAGKKYSGSAQGATGDCLCFASRVPGVFMPRSDRASGSPAEWEKLFLDAEPASPGEAYLLPDNRRFQECGPYSCFSSREGRCHWIRLSGIAGNWI